MAFVSNRPDFRVTLGKKDLTDELGPLLISLTLTDKRAGEADELEITLDDSTGALALPKPGALLHVALGWSQGSEVPNGLVDKGTFKVDEVEHSGQPDIVSIRARSADFTSAIKTRREKSWHDTTLGAIVSEIANRNKLVPRVAASLAGIAIASLHQSRESDMALVRRLGREHDAVATVKAGALIFAPIGSGATASGKKLPAIVLARRAGDRHRYQIAKRDDVDGVTATWHDRKGAKKQSVTVGSADNAKTLSRVYASEAAARAAAQAEHSRLSRQPTTLSFDLALGRPDIYPEMRATAVGFKPEIDATDWLIVTATHNLSGSGLMTSLSMESAG